MKITIATRESPLALWQARHVARLLEEKFQPLKTQLLPMSTQADRHQGALASVGGKGGFVKELEWALLREEADIAVHSLKDMPACLPEGLVCHSFGKRASPRDVWVSMSASELKDNGRRMGTSSLRRAAQIACYFPQCEVLPLRGNLQTRLRRLKSGDFDAIVLAEAGLIRMPELSEGFKIQPLDTDVLLPAPAQGMLAVEHLSKREDLSEILSVFVDPSDDACVRAERALCARLGVDCHTPFAAYAFLKDGETLNLVAELYEHDRQGLVRAHRVQAQGSKGDPRAVGDELAEAMAIYEPEKIFQGWQA